MNKVVVVSFMPIMEHMLSIFHMEALREAGFQLAFWNVCKPAFGRFSTQGPPALPELEHEFAAWDEVDAALEREDLDSTFFFCLAGVEARTEPLYALFQKHRAVTGFSMNTNWYFFSDLPLGPRLAAYLRHPGQLFRKVWGRLFRPRARGEGFLFDISFQCCATDNPPARRTVLCNAMPYDVERNAAPYGHPRRYALYLDNALTHHPDFSSAGLPHIGENAFLRPVNALFDAIEKDLGLEVIVAAHPKSRYGGHEFNGRAIIRDNTASLARGADLLLNTYSLSGLHALIFRKPVMFFVSDAFIEWSRRLPPPLSALPSIIRRMADSLGAPVLHLDRLDRCRPLRMPVVDTRVYDGERYRWLTHPQTEEASNADIFVAAIAGLDGAELRAEKLAGNA